MRTTNEKKKEKRKRDTVSGGAVDFVSFFFLSVLKSSVSTEAGIFIKSSFRLFVLSFVLSQLVAFYIAPKMVVSSYSGGPKAGRCSEGLATATAH